MHTYRRPVDSTDRAAHCRRLANGALPYQVVEQLERLASEYDASIDPPAPELDPASAAKPLAWLRPLIGG